MGSKKPRSANVSRASTRKPPPAAKHLPAQPPAAPSAKPVTHPPCKILALGERFKFRAVSKLAISPDGTKLCVQLSAHDAALNGVRSRLLLVDTSTGKSRWLTNGSEGDSLPVFWPDGRRVLFLSRRKLPAKDMNASLRAIWQIPLDGGEAELVKMHTTDIAGFTISPDGRRIAFLARDKTKRDPGAAPFESTRWLRHQAAPLRCYVLDVAARVVHRVKTGPAAHVTGAAFSPDALRLALAVSPSVLPNDGWRGRLLLAHLPPVTQPRSDSGPTGSKRKTKTKRTPPIRPVPVTPPLGVRSVAWSPDGHSVAFSSIGPTGDWLVSGALGLIRPPATLRAIRTSHPASRKSACTPLFLGTNLDEHLELVDYLPDSRHLLALGPTPFGRGLARLDVASGQGAWLNKSHSVYRHVCVARQTGDLAYLHESDTAPPTLFLTRAATKQTLRVMAVDRAQAEAGGHQVEFLWAAALDGTRTQAMVCWPEKPSAISSQLSAQEVRNQKSKIKNLKSTHPPSPIPQHPLIVVLHGGPMASFVNYFGPSLDPTALFPLRELIDRGAAVCWVNPRGSTGYGQALRTANVARIGAADADDVLAHVAQLIKTGRVDPARIALVGWSYGGFLAGCCATRVASPSGKRQLAGNLNTLNESLDPNANCKLAGNSAQTKEPVDPLADSSPLALPPGIRFASLVAGAAPCDFFGMFGSSDVHGTLERWIGGPLHQEPRYWDRLSPARMFAHWQLPTLLLHGTHDPRVSCEQSKLLFRMLREHRTPVRLHLLNGAGHMPADLRSLLTIHRLTYQWLARHLRLPAPRQIRKP